MFHDREEISKVRGAVQVRPASTSKSPQGEILSEGQRAKLGQDL